MIRMTTRLIQLQRGNQKAVAIVEEPQLRLLSRFDSVYVLAQAAIESGGSLKLLLQQNLTDERLDYDAIYEGSSDWKIIPPIHHSIDPARTLVAGTGLTHTCSAMNRNAMHGSSGTELSDSMKMFHLGLEGGRPEPGTIGVAPEWFYKGTGGILRAHREPLDVPPFADDGGEEAEVAGIYLIASDGTPWRIGFTVGNEFSDHIFEKKNYLNLAGSKLRTCSIGPEIVLDADFSNLPGEVKIERNGQPIWSKSISTGEAGMSHSLRNLEHHHFKFDTHRHPGDLHVHFFGAHSLSFGEGIHLQNNDVMMIRFDTMGRALRNTLRVASPQTFPVSVRTFQ
jgi:hypothetical protein